MPKPAGYIEVNERIMKFYAKYPTGSLQSVCTPFIVEAHGQSFVVYGAYAFRTPDDERPAIGWAWEPVPGPTNFTKDSELMNAETSAWGRAIAALGFEVREGIASANEVRARTGARVEPQAAAPKPAAEESPFPPEEAATSERGTSLFSQPRSSKSAQPPKSHKPDAPATGAQLEYIASLHQKHPESVPPVNPTRAEASAWIESWKAA